jgi:hypothetical protein
MAELPYMVGRKAYSRPQGLLLANNPGYISDGKRIPDGQEFEDFIILSDDNRGPINFSTNRLERKERTVNGRMRSYHIADKLNISVDWNMLPSRSFSVAPQFNDSTDPEPGKVKNLVEQATIEEVTRISGTMPVPPPNTTPAGESQVVRPRRENASVSPTGSPYYKDQQYTSDGGAGGVDLLDWYETYTGSFWLFLSYDKYTNLNNERDRLSEYSEVLEVFCSGFEYSVEKRGSSNHDFWNISLSLEEA